MRDELRQPLALLPRRSDAGIGISKPSESSVKKFIRGQSVPTGALSVEGPTKNKLCRAIMVSSHPSEPMVNEGGLSDAGPSHDRHDIDLPARPGIIQESEILLSPKNFASCN